MKGLLFDIKHFAIHDGPGIRQTIFFKGCPLRCAWCHNPESWKCGIEEFRVMKRLGKKEFEVKETIGKWYTVDELFHIIRKDVAFFNQSGGGVTFSGGEPMLQHVFLKAIAKQCKEAGIHTLVDTSGHVTYRRFKMINDFIDTYYFDIKHVDPLRHGEFTGVETELIMHNMKNLIQEGKEVVIRIPVIPAFNDDKDSLAEIKAMLKNSNAKTVHLLPYHEIGKSKRKRYDIGNNSHDKIPNYAINLEEIKRDFEYDQFQVTIEN